MRSSSLVLALAGLVLATLAFFAGASLPAHASPLQASCGNRRCEAPEDCNTCPQDCGDCCGNYRCEPPEDCNSCPQDCPC